MTTRQTPQQTRARTIRWSTALGAATLALALGGCGSMSSRETSTAAGAVLGGVAGAVITGGSTIGTVGGAAVGGVIGSNMDKNKKN